jgi:hypothetical protein
MKHILLVLSLALAVISIAQVNPIHGSWSCPMQGGYSMKLELKPGGSGTLDGQAITFSAANGKLTVTEAGEVTVYTYSINGNKMTVSGGDLDAPLVFTRQGSTTGLGAKVKENKVATPGEATAAGSILGSWTSATGKFTFNEGGKGTANGEGFMYTLAGNQLTMTDNSGVFSFSYNIAGNTLTLSAGAKTLTFNKGTAAAGAANNSGASTGKGAELAGKWCYLTSNYNSLYNASNSSFTNECFVINPNGTYSYAYESNRSASNSGGMVFSNNANADEGRWSYDGDKLTVYSNKGTTVNYTLEKKNHPKTKDPMLFLDGRGYVTFYQKASW